MEPSAMARWSETRGYSLVLRQPRGPDQYARIGLVQKRTLLGPAFNVREARAEDFGDDPTTPASLGGLGRLLSWRWLGESEAGELLAARLRTLEALGYTLISEQASKRGPWDWLRDLVQRQLSRPAGHEDRDARAWSEPHTTRSPRGAAAALRDALDRIGLEPGGLIEGIATIIGLSSDRVSHPAPGDASALEPELLAVLVPFWIEHDADALQQLGRRWLALPTTPYELDSSVVESWLAGEGRLARALASRLELEGLALLGPEGLARLAHKARENEIRLIAQRWRERLT